jgi:hypothetical protein
MNPSIYRSARDIKSFRQLAIVRVLFKSRWQALRGLSVHLRTPDM